MSQVERISVDEARKKLDTGKILLVCAYDSQEKCEMMKIQGAISLPELRKQEKDLSNNKEIVFYCA